MVNMFVDALLGKPPPRPMGWRLKHRARHAALAVTGGLTIRALYRIFDPQGPGRPPADQAQALMERHRALIERDLDNVEEGLYPATLLEQFPYREMLRSLPELALEVPRSARRRRRGGYDDLPADAHPEQYPRYYRRTFHWQSDGWLSDRSARLYDASVELLFAGTANVMRRMAIPALTRRFGRDGAPRILDVACGTGPLLRQLRLTFPQSRLTGIDLSPFYVERARARLGDADRVSVEQGNAEALPHPDASFDAVTCVFTFHELPPRVRRTVVQEMARVLVPGGLLVIVDSAQLNESASIRFFLESFPERFHEPYYRSYLDDPLEALVDDGELRLLRSEPHAVSKVVVAQKRA